ncbi:TolC family protein [bacterium]|nr:TolC family protein [candidate division CSSED10-310 bacterium]
MKQGLVNILCATILELVISGGSIAVEDQSLNSVTEYAETRDKVILTESETIRLALEQSEKLAVLETDMQIAGYRRDSAGKVENPELRLRESLLLDDPDGDRELNLSMRWRLPRFGELTRNRLEADVDVSRKHVDAIRYRLRTIIRIRKLFAETVLYDELVDLAKHRLELETERLELIEKMVDLGQRSVVYLTKSRMWLAESRHALTQCLKRQHDARRSLSQVTGKPEDAWLAPPALQIIDDDPDLLAEMAFRNRPEIHLAAQQTQLAVQKSRVERYKRLPRLTFGDLAYEIDDDREDRIEVTMGIELPLFNRNRGSIKAMDLTVKRKMNESSAMKEQIREEVNEAFEVYSECLTDWQNFDRDLGRLIAETGKVIENAREHSVLAPDEVLELDLVLIETRRILAEKRWRLAVALYDLFYAMGIEEYAPGNH